MPIPVRGDRITAVSAPAQYCLLVSGMPGAGKSTITQLVAERLARSARIDADFVTMLIVRGGVWALGEPADEAAQQVALKDQNVSSLAANFAAAGFTPVLDSVIPDPGADRVLRAYARTSAGRTGGAGTRG